MAGAENRFLAIHNEAQLAALQHRDLLVWMAVDWNDSVFLQLKTGHSEFIPVNNLSAEQWVQLFVFDQAPTVNLHRAVLYHEGL